MSIYHCAVLNMMDFCNVDLTKMSILFMSKWIFKYSSPNDTETETACLIQSDKERSEKYHAKKINKIFFGLFIKPPFIKPPCYSSLHIHHCRFVYCLSCTLKKAKWECLLCEEFLLFSGETLQHLLIAKGAITWGA